MPVPDFAKLLLPVTPERPCGEDLEYDAEYLALAQASLGKPERQMGEQVIPAEDPDWREVKRLGLQLLERSKDLRVAVPLARALLHTDGFSALAAALRGIDALLTQFWDGLYPLLDADDDNDPTMRVNTLLGLADSAGLLKSLRETPIIRARAAGNFSLRDVEIAAGRATVAADQKPPTPELIRAAFAEQAPPDLQALAATVQELAAAGKALAATLDGRLGGRAPNLAPLLAMLTAIATEVSAQHAARGGGAAPADAIAAAAGSGGGGGTPGAAADGGPATIRSREDVALWLSRICEFYARTEPGSPVPILLERARSLINRSFVDLIKDLVPDALAQVQVFQVRSEQTS